MATVNILSVNKRYENNIILNNINLNIEKGEFVALVGPSGSGKSTLLRLVAGLESVTEGKIEINEQCVNQIPPSKRNMAMVFQSYALYPHMTVFANMAYGLKMRGMKKHLIRQRVEEVGELLQIKEYLDRKPMALSGGQRQRVAMGRAIVRDPAVFLFDEPLSNLDSMLRTEMRHEIKKLHLKLRTTCLYVTHDQTEAMTLADKLVVLNKGSIEQVGSPQELYQRPATLFVASFIGHYPMNFIEGLVRNNTLHTNMDTILPLPKNLKLQNNKEVIVGVRPEHLKLDGEKSDMTAEVEFIEDMGSDKLVQVKSLKRNQPLLIRISGDQTIMGKEIDIKINLGKSSIFCKNSGQRLGGWDEE